MTSLTGADTDMLTSNIRTWLVTDDARLADSILLLESSKKSLHLRRIAAADAGSGQLKPKPEDILVIHLGELGLEIREVVELVDQVAGTLSASRVIVIDDEHCSKRGISLLSSGVTNYLARPLNLNQMELALEVLRVQAPAVKVAQAAKPQKATDLAQRQSPKAEPSLAPGYLTTGGGELYDNLLRCVLRVSKSNTTLLLAGETGTGKSHLAKVVHQASDRHDKPFITINCAAISPTLFESELFGHVRGAFTGADTDRTGKLTQAAEGTIFLDEIDSLPPSLQAKLLRVFEEKLYEAVGSNQSLPMKARLIVASNRDLKTEVAEGRFRSDLYYRLNVVSFEIPALRLRKSLIPNLVDRFLDESASRINVPRPSLTPETLALFQKYDWPGNIRELRNLIERAVVLCEDQRITPNDLTAEILSSVGQSKSVALAEQVSEPLDFHTSPTQHRLTEVVEHQEREMILESVNRNGFNLLRTAKDLGISRMTLYKKLEKYKIQRAACAGRKEVVGQAC